MKNKIFISYFSSVHDIRKALCERRLDPTGVSAWCWAFPEKLMSIRQDGKLQEIHPLDDIETMPNCVLVVHADTEEGDDGEAAALLENLASKIRLVELAYMNEGPDLVDALASEQIRFRSREALRQQQPIRDSPSPVIF